MYGAAQQLLTFETLAHAPQPPTRTPIRVVSTGANNPSPPPLRHEPCRSSSKRHAGRRRRPGHRPGRRWLPARLLRGRAEALLRLGAISRGTRTAGASGGAIAAASFNGGYDLARLYQSTLQQSERRAASSRPQGEASYKQGTRLSAHLAASRRSCAGLAGQLRCGSSWNQTSELRDSLSSQAQQGSFRRSVDTFVAITPAGGGWGSRRRRQTELVSGFSSDDDLVISLQHARGQQAYAAAPCIVRRYRRRSGR